MKKTTRVLAMLLSLLMTFSLCSISAFAEVEVDPDLSQYGEGYICFGDSYARGMGGSDDWDSIYYMDDVPGKLKYSYYGNRIYTTEECRNVEGAYTYLIAQSIGCNTTPNLTDRNGTYWPVAQNGLTLNAVMDLIGYDDGYFDDVYSHGMGFTKTRYNANLYYYGSPGKSVAPDGGIYYGDEGKAGDINELIANAKLITSALGMGDVLNRSYEILCASGYYDLENVENYPKIIEIALDAVDEGYSYWEEYYPLFLRYLKENSDATVVVVGVVNPIFNLTLSDVTMAPIGDAFSALTVKMNRQMKEWCEELGLVFVDISNVETGITEYDIAVTGEFLKDKSFADHPTVGGHQQIARMILAAVKEHDGLTETADKDITVDIGRFSKIDYVAVNGVVTKDYELNGHVLTVHCDTKLANNLTVSAVVNGKLAVSIYHVVYDNGYTAYRMYTTNSVTKAVDNALSSLKGLFSR